MDSSLLKGVELGKFVLSSGLLDSSWSKISEIHELSYPNKDSALGINIYQEANFTLVVFTAPPFRVNESCTSASTLVFDTKSQNLNPFHFLCSETTPSFSLHTPALDLFTSVYTKNLFDLKSQLLKSKKPVIITGAALGGAVASLFTLWLLETISPELKRPLCITFGSPFIGDAKLQQILENSVRNSCFLHVVDALQIPITEGLKPSGTYLICYESECVCIEDPEAVTELLNGVNSGLVDWRDYGKMLHRLNQSVLSMEDSRLITDDVIIRINELASNKKLRFDPFKKLNLMKVSMAKIEWYKKKCKEAKNGYYDQYRFEFPTTADTDVETLKKELIYFWTSVVEDVEKKPQSDISMLTSRFLFAGNNYRRMIEPLDIAEYYRKGMKEYRTSGRSRHYVMLEKWFGKESIGPVRCEKKDLSDLLTFDSCFWAEVEEAMIVIKSLKTQVVMRDGWREVLLKKLVTFEEYVWEMIGKREVSPEIFLEKSSFMKWWKVYKEMKEREDGFNSSPTQFTEFMNTGEYESYGKPHDSNSRG